MVTTKTVAPRRDAPESDGRAQRHARERIVRRAFVVDDDPATRHLLGEVVADLGWQAERFASLGAVRVALRRAQPDLVILDDDLPDGTGGDFAVELRANAHLRSLPIVHRRGASQAPGDRTHCAGSRQAVRSRHPRAHARGGGVRPHLSGHSALRALLGWAPCAPCCSPTSFPRPSTAAPASTSVS